MSQVDELLTRRRSVIEDLEYLPQSIEAATNMLPDAGWVLISEDDAWVTIKAGHPAEELFFVAAPTEVHELILDHRGEVDEPEAEVGRAERTPDLVELAEVALELFHDLLGASALA